MAENGPTGISAADVVAGAPALMLDPERVLLHALVRGLRPEHVLEDRNAQGGSTMIMCAALDEIGKGAIVCIDPNPVVEPQHWETVAHRATMIVGTSPDAVPQAAEMAGGAFDFVLIDGDHTTEGVRRDLEGLLPCLHRTRTSSSTTPTTGRSRRRSTNRSRRFPGSWSTAARSRDRSSPRPKLGWSPVIPSSGEGFACSDT